MATSSTRFIDFDSLAVQYTTLEAIRAANLPDQVFAWAREATFKAAFGHAFDALIQCQRFKEDVATYSIRLTREEFRFVCHEDPDVLKKGCYGEGPFAFTWSDESEMGTFILYQQSTRPLLRPALISDELQKLNKAVARGPAGRKAVASRQEHMVVMCQIPGVLGDTYMPEDCTMAACSAVQAVMARAAKDMMRTPALKDRARLLRECIKECEGILATLG